MDEVQALPDHLMFVFESTGVYPKLVETLCQKSNLLEAKKQWHCVVGKQISMTPTNWHKCTNKIFVQKKYNNMISIMKCVIISILPKNRG